VQAGADDAAADGVPVADGEADGAGEAAGVQSAGGGTAGSVAAAPAAARVRDPAAFPCALAFRKAVALPGFFAAEFAAGAGAIWCTATGEPVRALRTLRTMSRTTPGSWP
jgi:hypothetical protein